MNEDGFFLFIPFVMLCCIVSRYLKIEIQLKFYHVWGIVSLYANVVFLLHVLHFLLAIACLNQT